MPPRLLTTKEFAQKIGVTAKTVRVWMRQRRITFVALTRTDKRIPEDEACRWISARTFKAKNT